MSTSANIKSAAPERQAAVAALPDRAVKLLATSIFTQLQGEGCKPKDIISISSQLLSLVTSELTKLSAPSQQK